MKKLLLIALLLVALVATAVACTNDDKPADDTTVAETTGAIEPGETTVDGRETEGETTVKEEVTTKEEETTPEESTEEITTEEETKDPYQPIDLIVYKQLEVSTGASDLSASVKDDLCVEITPANANGYYIPLTNREGGRYIVIKYRTGTAVGMSTRVYIGSEGEAPADESVGYVEAGLTADGEWHLAILDTQALIDAGIYNGKTYTYFRYDALEGTLPEDASIDVEYIAFFNSLEPIEAYNNYLESRPVPLHYTDAWILSERASAGGTVTYGWYFMERRDNNRYVSAESGFSDPRFDVYTESFTTGGRYIVVKYRTDAATASMQIYIGSSGTGPSNDDQMVEQPVINDMQWHTIVFDTKPIMDKDYYDGTTVAWMRFDALNPDFVYDENGEIVLSMDANGNLVPLRANLADHAYIEFEYIAFFDDEAEANAFAADFTYTPPAGEPVWVADAADLEITEEVNDLTFIESATMSSTGDYTTILLEKSQDIDPYCNYLVVDPIAGGRYIGFKYRVETAEEVMVEFFLSSNGPIKDASNQVHVGLIGDGEWHIGVIDTSVMNSAVYDGLNLDVIRFDPIANVSAGGVGGNLGTDTIDYAWIGMFHTAEDITAYDEGHPLVGE